MKRDPADGARVQPLCLRSGCANLGEEAVDLVGEVARLRRELLGGAEHTARGGAGVVGGAQDAGDVGVDLLRAARGFLDAARDLLGGRAVLLGWGRDRRADLVELCGDVDDVADGRYSLVS